MISWEDTVMNWEDINLCGIKHIIFTEDATAVTQTQAKLSFPAGEKQGHEKGIKEERANWVTTGNELLKEHPIAGAFWLILADKIIVASLTQEVGG